MKLTPDSFPFVYVWSSYNDARRRKRFLSLHRATIIPAVCELLLNARRFEEGDKKSVEIIDSILKKEKKKRLRLLYKLNKRKDFLILLRKYVTKFKDGGKNSFSAA